MTKTGTQKLQLSAVRLLLLAALVAVIDGWLAHHVGLDVAGLSLATGFMAVAGFVVGALRAEEKAEFSKLVRSVLFHLSDRSFLVGCAVAIAIAGSCFSSVRVIADGAGDLKVSVTAAGRASAADGEKPLSANEMVRFFRVTSPFGRTFVLDVKGYLPHFLDLYPWTGATIRASRDLQRAPAILIRVPEGKFSLLDGGKIKATAGGRDEEVATKAGHASVILGRRIPVPRRMIEDWHSELLAKGIEGSVAEKRIRGWKNPLAASEGFVIAPGTIVRTVFLSRDGSLMAEAEFIVTGEAVQDVYLEPVLPE